MQLLEVILAAWKGSSADGADASDDSLLVVLNLVMVTLVVLVVMMVVMMMNDSGGNGNGAEGCVVAAERNCYLILISFYQSTIHLESHSITS